MLGRMGALASALLLGACSVIGVRSGTEEPSYAVVAREGPVEIRRYGQRLAAETVVEGEEAVARNAGFRRLAGYIFGGSQPQQRIAMTAPVEQATAAPTRIAMTAPVTQAPADGQARAWRIRFFMPARWTAETLPAPNDPAVRIVSLPEESFAVLRFSGVPTPEAVARQRATLLGALDGTPWRAVGEVQDWFFDPPWTLPAARRNEVAVRVEARR